MLIGLDHRSDLIQYLKPLQPRSYEELVGEFEQQEGGLPFLFIRRDPQKSHRHMVVCLSTHNEGQKYRPLPSAYRYIDADLLFVRDPANSYYLQDDKGAAYLSLIKRLSAPYKPQDIVMFGSSMAGYAALRWALAINANAVVSNPQLSLTATIPLAWTELRRNIEKISPRYDLSDRDFGNRASAITLLHSRHEMDLENTRIFFELYRDNPGLAVMAVQVDEVNHKYLIPDMKMFIMFLKRTIELRYSRDRIHQ